MDTPVARFRYHRAGSGSPVLLLPGSGGWRLSFHTMIGVLSTHHTVYALDPPGQGGTVVVDPESRHDTDAIAHAIAAFLDAAGLSEVAVVGHSWGGGFALRLAELHPTRVRRLALLAPAGLDVPDVWEFRLLRRPVIGELAVRLMSAASVRHMLRKSFAHRDRIPYALARGVAAEMRAPRNRSTLLRVERSVRWAATERDLHLVKAPVLLLWGERDRYLPASLLPRFTARLATIEAHVLSRCGHSLHDDCPDETYRRLIPFLEADEPTPTTGRPHYAT
ncbi:alpha/beta fold hydrolase [Nonomuraea sp. H19]|uniref:alpha/beta fold hydrolase n=1 Tax=Nonomuraea sp. H19 TaxID=3452206 RepID=UPI003F8AA91F